jgi:hypothetical protein
MKYAILAAVAVSALCLLPLTHPADAGPRLGVASDDRENDAGEKDARISLPNVRATAGGGTQRLHAHPKRDEIVRKITDALRNKEINVQLLGGHKYMANDCLGIKASAGSFKLKLANPVVKLDGNALVVAAGIDRISMSALKLRMRPNSSNPLKPCQFSKRFEVGGSAKDVRIEVRVDPLLNLQQCKLGTPGGAHTRIRIGNLNLKPLQNNLDNMAKNMIEDSLTYFVEFNIVNQIIRTIDDVLEADCPGKKLKKR